ncbi:Pentatricopeptide repeat-containing protein At2g27610 [Linum perenne]
MYAKYGDIWSAHKLFDELPERNTVTWNSLISGYLDADSPKLAVRLFVEMLREEATSDATTFLAVLSACSHAGFVDKGLKYFDLLKKNGSSLGAPRLEHYASVVDIFGRAGYLKEAAEFIRNMPVKPGPSVYKALLSACLVHGDLETAELSARKLLDLSPDDSAAYVMLFNMLKRSDHWNDAEALQRLICYRGLKKMPGYSWF